MKIFGILILGNLIVWAFLAIVIDFFFSFSLIMCADTQGEMKTNTILWINNPKTATEVLLIIFWFSVFYI
jgi:hypothetical protein